MDKLIKKFLNREFITYVIFGLVTTFLNIGMYSLLLQIGLEYKISNIITLITVKTIAYLLNKFFVFKTKCENNLDLLKEIYRYVIARGFTMIVDYILLIFLVDVLELDNFSSKIFVTILVVVLNYITSKKSVFTK